MSSCASSGAPGGPPDAALADAGDPDAKPDGSNEGGGFGDPCDETVDCQPGSVCYHPQPGGPGTCSQFCTTDCPPGYECKTVPLGDTLEATICVPAEQTFCDSCQTNADCGDSRDLCIQLTAGRFCSINCKEDPTVCPTGFNCANLVTIGDGNVWQCVPQNGVCCVDGDGDQRGEGDGCKAGDCDDTNPVVYDDAAEVCDGYDNDCIGGIDVNPQDCAPAKCEYSTGANRYFERPADECAGMEHCQVKEQVPCNLYTCSDGAETGDHCAIACDGEVDVKCVSDAHCDSSACLLDLDNGLASNEDSDCKSDHSQNGFCCNSGDCCKVASDCPTFGGSAPICEDTATCQGSRGQAICTSNECGAQNGVPDDTACTTDVIANECGLYQAVHCTGAANQTPPSCPTTCSSNADCDSNAFCDPITDKCLPDLDNGQQCPQGNPSCASGHCQNGFCCTSGDCCASETDCPSSYSTPATCDTPSACQGTADVAQCVTNSCTTSLNVPDDSACGTDVTANTCGPYLPIQCSGGQNQAPPACPTSCTTSGQCDPNAYCNPSGACVPDEPNGNACTADGNCLAGHCQNGFCCDSGDCCANANDCNAYDVTPTCDAQMTCQGTRKDGVCSASFQCSQVTSDDDSKCAGLPSNDCGPYPGVQCTGAVDQPINQGGLCPNMCIDDTQCDGSAHCAGGICQPDTGTGGFCNTTNECGAGLQCVDNVCCTSSCNGSCEACDLPGKEGSCSAVPDGQDPDGECPAVSCTGFFAGWSGDSCYRKADLNAAAATCGGDRACRTAAEECTLQQSAGAIAITCDDTCQDPNLSTCAGISAGQCGNVNPGNQTCGQGICQRTVPICTNGGDNTCVPGNPTGESCNDLDDNCDGTVDNSSSFEDSPDSTGCGNLTTLAEIPSDGTQTTLRKLYPSGDQDFFKVRLHESDSDCGCGISFDEDYLITVKLTVPVGGGSYQVCRGVNDCSDQQCVTVSAGTTGQIQFMQDGACGPFNSNDNYDLYLHVKGINNPGFECQPYQLDVTFDAGQCS